VASTRWTVVAMAAPPRQVRHRRDSLKGRLMRIPAEGGGGLRTHHLVALLITTHAPFTLLWAVVPTALQNGQVVATPLILVLAGLILLGFVLGYSGLARRVRGAMVAVVLRATRPSVYAAIGSANGGGLDAVAVPSAGSARQAAPGGSRIRTKES
jgi:hypothetical protein